MKKAMNYEAPVAEMIEMQASMVLMASGTTPAPTPTPGPTPGGHSTGGGTGGGIGGGGEFGS